MLRPPLVPLLLLLCLAVALPAIADDEKSDKAEKTSDSATKIRLADGRLTLLAPKEWKKVKPRNRIIRFEFAAPAVEGDEEDGRVTIMGAGGSVERNVARWQGQFTQPDNKSTKDRTKVEKQKISGCEVHVVDITGSFKEPFSRTPTVRRKDYRMLTAIIVTPKSGQYFVKLYGPKKTVAANEEGFRKLIKEVDFK